MQGAYSLDQVRAVLLASADGQHERIDDEIFHQEIDLQPGSYEFLILDEMEDGLIRHWWLRGYDPERMGENGRIQFRSLQDSVLIDLGYDFAEKENLQFFIGKPN